MRSWTDRGLARVATLALLSLLAVVTLGALEHTDDGCAVEVHCQVCVFALHAVDGAVATVVVLPSVVTTLTVTLPLAERPSAGAAPVVVSRGPPSV